MSARTVIRSLSAVAVAGAVFALAACGTGAPGQTTAPSDSASPTPSASAPESPSPEPSSPSPDPSETTEPPQANATISLPTSCEQIYSAGMLSTLEQGNPPLNDPELSLLSTGIEDVYAVLDSGIPTLRCTWGVPSEVGLATTVAIVDDAQRASIEQMLVANSLTCSDFDGGRLCRVVMEYEADDLNPGHTSGETHYLRGNGWVATSWLNFGPSGYTEDIVNTLWG